MMATNYKDNPRTVRKISPTLNYLSGKGLIIPKIYKALVEHYKKFNPSKIWGKWWKETSSKKKNKWKRHEKYASLFIIRVIQIRTTMRHHLTQEGLAFINKNQESSVLVVICRGGRIRDSHSLLLRMSTDLAKWSTQLVQTKILASYTIQQYFSLKYTLIYKEPKHNEEKTFAFLYSFFN